VKYESKVRCDQCGEWVASESATRTEYRGYVTISTVKCSRCRLRESDPAIADLLDQMDKASKGASP
jgi:C4-type Zn-finger protein